MSKEDPFDISPEEYAENEKIVRGTIQLGTMKYNQLCSMTTEIGDFIKNFPEDQLEAYQIIEALQEWHETLEQITDF